MAIFLKQSRYKNGRVFLSIVNGFYNPTSKNSKQITIEKIGFLDELKKIYDDPISFYKKKAADLNDEQKETKTITKTIDLNEELSDNDQKYNLGYVFLKYLYQELGIDKYLSKKQKILNVDYDLNQIFSLLIFSRILFPGSKKETFENKNTFFD